jgi:chromosomal replication initiator protein
LRSRFEGGILADIPAPEFETRVAILQAKAAITLQRIPLDVLMLVAERIDSNIRELEGTLNQLLLQAQLQHAPLTVSLATRVLNNLSPRRTPGAPAQVIALVASHYGLEAEDLLGRRRTAAVAQARQVAMFLLREENGLSLPAIGDYLGGRDHTTIRHGVEKITTDLERDEALRRDLTILREKVYTR